MRTASPPVGIFLICNLLLLASSFWLRHDSVEMEEEEGMLRLEDSVGESLFNSRGPRSLYRGLEEDTELSWDIIEDYDEDDQNLSIWNFYEY